MSSRYNHWWLKQLFRTRPIPAGPTRLRAESLEDRITPTAYVVTSFADDGSAGTLRSILSQVNADPAQAGDDTVTFNASGAVTLTQGLLEISRTAGAVTIDGGGDAVAVSGNNASRVFLVDFGVRTALTALTVTAGSAGGIDNQGTLTVTGSTVTGNSGSGIFSQGALTVTGSTVSDNTFSEGGGIYSQGTLTVTGSTSPATVASRPAASRSTAARRR